MALSEGAQMQQDQDTRDLLYEVRGPIAWVTFNRPQARNALTFEMYDRLAGICAEVDADPAIRVMILRGAGGKAFASGTDISQFTEFKTREDALGYEARIERVLKALEQCRVATIASITGACTGGGAAIAACCDLRIAGREARFGLPIARTLGNCLAPANLARFAALVGPSRLMDLVFTARLMGASEALSIGLVIELADDPDARAGELAETVAGHAPLTLEATKTAMRLLRTEMPREEAEKLVLKCYLSEDFHEGVSAFLAKRKPDFKGR